MGASGTPGAQNQILERGTGRGMPLNSRQHIVICQSQISTLNEKIGAENTEISRLTERLRTCGVPSEKEQERIVGNIVRILEDATARNIRLPPESLDPRALKREARSMHSGLTVQSVTVHIAYEIQKLGTAGRAVGKQMFVQLDALGGEKNAIRREISTLKEKIRAAKKEIRRVREIIAMYENRLAFHETETPERDDPSGLRCGGCEKHRPKLDYSPSQLKKKGRRRCHTCVGEAPV